MNGELLRKNLTWVASGLLLLFPTGLLMIDSLGSILMLIASISGLIALKIPALYPISRSQYKLIWTVLLYFGVAATSYLIYCLQELPLLDLLNAYKWFAIAILILLLVYLSPLVFKEVSLPAKCVWTITIICFAFIFFYAAEKVNAQGNRELARFLRFITLIPCLILFSRVRTKPAYFWWGLVIASLVAGICAAYQIFVMDMKRAQGSTHAIIFGGLTMVFAFTMLVSMPYFKARNNWLLVIPIAGFVFAMTASVLSGSRGSWLAFPPLLILLLIIFWGQLNQIKRSILIVSPMILISVLFLLPETSMQSRTHKAINEVQLYFENYEVGSLTSSGQRLEMWKAALFAFKENPVFGIGLGRYQDATQHLVAEGKIKPLLQEFSHAHNEYLFAMAGRGTAGLIALLLLFFVPLREFWRGLRLTDPQQRAIPACGLILILGYMIFGLTEAIFAQSLPINFYLFYLASISYFSSRFIQDAMKIN